MKCPFCSYDKIQPAFNFCPQCKRSLKGLNIGPEEDSQSQQPVKEADINGEYSEDVYRTAPPGYSTAMSKGFINRAFSRWTYEKAMANPYGYANWAHSNPNDNLVFLRQWHKEGKDLTVIRSAIAEANRARLENPTVDKPDVEANIIDSTRQSSRRSSDDDFVQSVNAAQTTDAASIVRNKAIWKLQPGELARHIAADEWCYVSEHLEGLVIEEGTSAIIFVDGQEVAQMGSGMYVFDSKHSAAAEIEAARRAREHQGIFSRLADSIYRFFTGHKREESTSQRDQRRRRVQQIIGQLKKDTIIDVYLKSNRVFPAIFGAQYSSDSPEGYQPYVIQSRYLDLQVGVSMQMQISNFKDFIANYLQGRKTVTIDDVVKSVDHAVWTILRTRLRDIEVSERGLDEVTFNSLRGHLISKLPNLLHGIAVIDVLDISTSNEQLNRFRQVESQLYCSEQEYDFLIRTNEFRNRIAAEENDQKIREARSEQDLRVRLDEINKDNLIHNDEMEQFVSLLMNQKVIREATNKADLDKAMLDIERNRLISQDEFDIFTNDLENRRFDRNQVSEQLRARSLMATALQYMDVTKTLVLQNIDNKKTVNIANIQAQDEVSDAEWAAYRKTQAHAAEDWDLMATIYGRKYAFEKQELIDAAEKRRLQNSVEAEEIKGNRQKKAAVREDIWETHTLYESINDDIHTRKVRERDDDYQHRLRVQQDEIDQLTKLIDLAHNQKDRDAQRDLELQRAEKELELIKTKEEHEYELNKKKEDHQHEIAKANIQADVDKTRITAQSNMSAGQLMSQNIATMDAAAQAKFAESFSHLNELELAKKSAEEKERIYKTMIDMAEANNIRMQNVMGANAKQQTDLLQSVLTALAQMNASQSAGQQSMNNNLLGVLQNFANTRLNDAKDLKDEYRNQMHHEQDRTDEAHKQALNYTTHVKVSENAPNTVGGTSVNVHVTYHTCPFCKEKIDDTNLPFCPYCGQEL